MEHNYESYNIEDFLNDPLFIEWMKYRTPQSEKMWNDWVKQSPVNLSVFYEAKLHLEILLSAKKPYVDLQRKETVWNIIDTSTGNGTIRSFYYKWTAIAAAVVVAVFSVWLLNSSKNDQPLKSNMAQTKKEIIAPGTNQAILTLADGKTIALDSATAGSIASQGGVNLLKSNGSLTYLPESVSNTTSVINTVSIPRGGQYKLVLADGSKVWLNAASELTFPSAFTGEERKVTLKGEGYFEVAHDKNKPFFVQVNGMEVKVLGTEFNINSYPDESGIRTTLVKGSVVIHAGKQTAKLSPGEQAVLQQESGTLNVKSVDVESQVSWKNGKFIFQDLDIYAVMRQLARWYNIDVVYGQHIPDEQFVGVISRNVSIAEVLSMLESTEAVSFRVQGRRVYVTPFKK